MRCWQRRRLMHSFHPIKLCPDDYEAAAFAQYGDGNFNGVWRHKNSSEMKANGAPCGKSLLKLTAIIGIPSHQTLEKAVQNHVLKPQARP